MAGLPVRRAPYKDFLQPALQRRFSSTATVLLVVAYIQAVALSSWNSLLWSWFPLGPAGFRTAAFFTCGLAILILRIAHYHVGRRTAGAGYNTLRANLTKISTYETVFWYLVSSSVFCQVYLGAMPASANLKWVVYFSGDRARLNERPVFLGVYLGYCAIKQSIDHFKDDIDHLDLGAVDRKDNRDAVEASTSLKKTLWQFPSKLAHAGMQAVWAFVPVIPIYLSLVRTAVWGWALTFLRPFYNMPKTNLPPASWPLDPFLFVRSILAGTLLFFIWTAGNVAFSVFMVKEPLKNGQPLTSESKDPNGSLLNGLKSKKLSIQCFAMWELSLIAQRFEERRRAIYADIDRKDGPMWSQVYAACMEVIKSIEARADNYGKVQKPAASTDATLTTRDSLKPLPESKDPIFRNQPSSHSQSGKALQIINQSVQAIGNSSDGSSLKKLSPYAKRSWKHAKDQFLNEEQQEAVSPEAIKGSFETMTLWLIGTSSWGGALLRQDYRTDLAAAALGTPDAEPWLYVNAVRALAQLAVHSLGEDQYGNVHRDVASIIRTLTSVIRKVEDLRQRVPVHWTDAGSPKESPEVEHVLDAMRASLSEVVTSFEPFCHDLRLTPGDLRLAKEAAASPVRD